MMGEVGHIVDAAGNLVAIGVVEDAESGVASGFYLRETCGNCGSDDVRCFVVDDLRTGERRSRCTPCILSVRDSGVDPMGFGRLSARVFHLTAPDMEGD